MTASSTTPQTPPRHQWQLFSLRRLWALASATFTQLIRMKTLYFLLIFGLALFVLGFIIPSPPTSNMTVFGGEQELRLLKASSLGGMSLFSVLLAICATAMLLPRDVEDRTLYTILCKPVPRLEYLLGKWLGVVMLMGLTLLLMDLACIGLLALKQKIVMAQELAYWDSRGLLNIEKKEEIARLYARYGAQGPLHGAVIGLFCQSAVMAALALLISTVASSTIFTILVTLAIFIIGHGQEMAREYLFKDLIAPLQRVLSLIVTLIFPDVKQFNIIDEVVAGKAVPWAYIGRMTVSALLYVVAYQVASWFIFRDKEL
jgi:ABC-type Na+ efflux pump permease subunit